MGKTPFRMAGKKGQFDIVELQVSIWMLIMPMEWLIFGLKYMHDY